MDAPNLNGGEVNSGQEADVNINNDAVLTPAEPEEAAIAFALLHQHERASHYGLPYNYRQACALLGCSLPRANSGSFYCCTGHEEICKTWSSRTGEAHVVYYGFIKSTSPYLEHVCTTSIILKSQGVDVGIPFMKPESVWNKAPWENDLLGRDYNLQEKTRLWLYFTTQEECFKHLENEARVDFKWYTNGRNKRLVDGVWVNVTLLTVQLTKEKEKKKIALTDVEKEVKEVLKCWRIHLFDYKEHSLCCLSVTRGDVKELELPPKIPSRKKDDNKDGDNSDKETGKENDTETAETTTQDWGSSLSLSIQVAPPVGSKRGRTGCSKEPNKTEEARGNISPSCH